jgi:hypothetical protein
MPEEGIVTESRDVSGFDRVQLGGVGNVVITQGDSFALTIHAAEDVLPRVTSEVKKGTLVLGIKASGWIRGLTKKRLSIRYEVTMKDITGLTLSGAGRIDAPAVRADSLSVTVSGAGGLTLGRLEANSLEVLLSGAGNCEAAGKVDSQSIKLTGAGSYSAAELESDTAEAMVSGAGDINILVNDRLDARVSGAGSIRYHGGATVRQRVTGVGSVRCLCDS